MAIYCATASSTVPKHDPHPAVNTGSQTEGGYVKVKEHAHRGASGLVIWIRGLLARCVGFGSESTLDSVSRLAK